MDATQHSINHDNTILIRKPWLARKLIQAGYEIKDIKPNKFDAKASVYVFAKTDGIEDAKDKFISEHNDRVNNAIEKRKNRENKNHDDKQSGKMTPNEFYKKFNELKKQIDEMVSYKVIK